MKLNRPLAALAAALALPASSCKLVEMPFDAVGSLLKAGGRTLGLSSENTRKQDDFNIEAREAREALAVAEQPVVPVVVPDETATETEPAPGALVVGR